MDVAARNPLAAFAALTPAQRKTFVAAFPGWTLDAFDFFLVTFVVTRISTDFHETIPAVAFAITITLMLRPLGGWRGMFVIGALPALLVVHIRSSIPESPVWLARRAQPLGKSGGLWSSFLAQPRLYVYAILLMAAFNFMSHGSRDLYPTFLQKQKERSRPSAARIATASAKTAPTASTADFRAVEA